ncbi:MAG TPA: retropepsin-like aspartic protease [Candidatus Nanoarchaeia archaeon]|nr:retropepsin-like aspartic protease [Candidatus Nanoarchaeia archaeon]
MTLSYKFKKFKLENGMYTKRPIVDIILKHEDKYLEFGAILDSGSDLTTIPKTVADYLGLKTENAELEMVGYRGMGKVRESRVTIIFKGKAQRQEEILNNVPIAVMQDPFEEDVIIGTFGVFEYFKIVFNDTKNISFTRLSKF